MLRLVALLLLTACSAAPTSLKITLYSSGGINPPEAFAVSIWDPHGPLVLGKVVRGEVPGTLFIINLPDVDQVLRVGFADADTGAPLIAARIPVRAHEETDAVLHVDGTTDSDNDDVPDPIDNCPDDPNREQRDADGDGVGDNCAGRDFGVIADLTGFDLAGADLARPPCNALFCDGFDDDLVTSTYLTSPGGTLRWDKLDGDPQHTFTEIDFLPGALASPRSLRFRLQGDAPGGMVADYQRYGVGIGLHSGIPNWTKLLNGPTYMRFYVKLSDPPQVQHGGEVSMAYVWWGNESNNLELRATNSGVSLNVRFPFGTFTRDTTPQAVGWVGGFVCVEWKHESVPDADAGLVYRSVVWVNDVEAATFEGTGVPAVFSGFILGADVEFRPDIPAFTHFTEWFDEVKFSDQKIGCN